MIIKGGFVKYDVLIVGGATSGSFFARRMAEQGYSVAVLDASPEEKIGSKYDIFHVCKRDFENFGLPLPSKEDGTWAFEFSEGLTASPYNNYPKTTYDPIIGMHMHEYVLKMNRWAKEKGAEFIYGAKFTSPIFSAGRIVGVKYEKDGDEKEIYARVTVDASGMGGCVRTALPDGYGVENFTLKGNDMFYVVLRYVSLENEKDYLNGSCGWPFYKTWIAPQHDPHGAILGIGACNSFAYAEEVYKKFEENIPLPGHKIQYFERGTTPYCRCPYSFVADNFIATGDAACLTKPLNGEGVTSSMVHMEIAAKVLGKALKKHKTRKEDLWEINTLYNKAQGADFCFLRAVLTKAVCAKVQEWEYFFQNDIIFSEDLMNSVSTGEEIPLTPDVISNMVKNIARGMKKGIITKETVKTMGGGIVLAINLKNHYLNFPVSPEGFTDWCKKADKIWAKVGKMQ